jgi:hypothetical protein
MTFTYPDLYHGDAPLSLTGAQFVMLKATEGLSFVDSQYVRWAAQAHDEGIPWGAYHFLHNSNPGGQAANAYHVVGPHVPLMVDVEKTVTGQDNPTLPALLDFIRAYRKLGGLVHLAYVPRWYWTDVLHSPMLTPVTQLGVQVVASAYATYSDTAPGWQPYGGVIPAVLQYTDSQRFNGKSVDFNAYRGTLAQFLSMISGGTMAILSPQDLSWQIENVPAPDGTRKILTQAIGEWAAAIHALQETVAKVTTSDVAPPDVQVIDAEISKALGAGVEAVKPTPAPGG